MWKFVRGKSQHLSVERQKLQKELFAFRKTVQHGFPSKPTALAWDPELRIAVIGTISGAIKAYGKCGVEFYGHHSTADRVVMKIVFVPNQGRLISLSDCNSLHLWEINDAAIEELKSFVMEGKLKKISSLYVENSKKNLLVGTEGGNIYFVSLDSFTVSENVIYQDVVMQNVPEGYKINPGAVEIMAEQPNNTDNLLIGYSRGLMVLWNKTNSEALQTYVNNQQLESFCWHSNGKQFVSSHNDGSYIFWGADCNEPSEEPITVYGPFPCKAITKILWHKSTVDEENLIIFGGGMPRASYSDRNTVTVQRGTSKHVVFDFTSKVVDFFAICDNNQICEALLILLEEELVAIDLASEDWRTIPLPYLMSLHASAVTFLTYVCDVSPTIWKNICTLGKQQMQENYSSMEWPINGGILKKKVDDEKTSRDVCVTGHEDGSVRFWNAGTTVLSLIYIFKSSSFFLSDDEPFEDDFADNQNDEKEEWPPFKKVGFFDPYTDDPRFSIKKISFCGISGALIVAGTAGQIIICELNLDAVTNKALKISVVNLVPEKDPSSDEGTSNWKGFQRLAIRGKVEKNETVVSLAAGFQPSCILQLLPPMAITALALNSGWNLIAVGSAYGLVLYDYKTKLHVLSKSTLNPSDFSTLNEPPISRTKSFKKSLRESFRRIRKGRASVRYNEKQRSGSKSPVSPTAASSDKRVGSSEPSSSSPAAVNPLETKPIERAIEARATDDAFGNMVRCLCFARTFIINGHTLTPCLWAGTNNGTVYIFTMIVPGGCKRKNEKVHAQLGKEIQLKHKAPVVSIAVIDGANRLLPEAIEVEEGLCKPADNSSPHHVIIGSEEQFKVFSLPNLRPTCKLKLTAMEGAKVRRMALGIFKSANHAETCLLSLTNLGECIVLSLPDLRRLVTAAVIKREDINGISSFIFTKWGEGLYLHSSSEIQRISLSTSRKTMPNCAIKLDKNISKKLQQSVFTSEKLQGVIVNAGGRIINNEILEEDEEEEEENEECSENDGEDEQDEEEGSKTKRRIEETIQRNVNGNKGSTIDVKKSVDEESQLTYSHDISAITVDSVKDHLNSGSISINEMNVSNSSSNTTIENSVANVSISENRVEVSV